MLKDTKLKPAHITLPVEDNDDTDIPVYGKCMDGWG